MTTDADNGAIVRELWDAVWSRGELGRIDDLVGDFYFNLGAQLTNGREAMRDIVTAWRAAFPDLQVEVQEEIIQGDKVVHRVMMRGTHRGEFRAGVGPGRIMGAIAPTGRSFAVDQMHIHRVAGGKIVEHAASRNDLLLLHQLGLLPVPALSGGEATTGAPADTAH